MTDRFEVLKYYRLGDAPVLQERTGSMPRFIFTSCRLLAWSNYGHSASALMVHIVTSNNNNIVTLLGLCPVAQQYGLL